jgi:selenocysteine lyase/cysteine desulfurase
VRELNELLFEGLDELGARAMTPRDPERHGALVCVASTDVDALVAALDAEGVVTSSRDGNLRISAHCYNTADDVQVVLDLLAAHRDLLAPA